MGVLQRLPHIIGQGFTREMAYTARFYSAKEAERMGLVNSVYPDREALLAGAKELAAQIAANAPLAVMATKEVLNYSRTATIEEGMDRAIQKMPSSSPRRTSAKPPWPSRKRGSLNSRVNSKTGTGN